MNLDSIHVSITDLDFKKSRNLIQEVSPKGPLTTPQPHIIGWELQLLHANGHQGDSLSAPVGWPAQVKGRIHIRTRASCHQREGAPCGLWGQRRPSPPEAKAWPKAPMAEEGAWLWLISPAFPHSEYRIFPLLRSDHRLQSRLSLITLW